MTFKGDILFIHDACTGVAGSASASEPPLSRQAAANPRLSALNARLLTDTAHPLVGARGRVTGLARLLAFESTGGDIVAAAEERLEESDLRRGRRRPINEARVPVHQSGSVQ